MYRTIKLGGNRSVKIISEKDLAKSISKSDAEMDIRAKKAVELAISKAKSSKKPVAKYDRISRKAYIETAEGEKIYIG